MGHARWGDIGGADAGGYDAAIGAHGHPMYVEGGGVGTTYQPGIHW